MAMFFSRERLGFFDSADRDAHDRGAEGWPVDAVELSDAEYQLALMVPSGKQLAADEFGRPVFVDAKPDAFASQICTPAQGLIALFVLKRITEAEVLNAIGSIADDVQRYTAQIGYQRATTWDRSSPTMQLMAQLLQLSEKDLDELYAYAVTVQV